MTMQEVNFLVVSATYACNIREMSKLSLSDIKPQEFSFSLSEFPDKKFTLRKFTLAEQIWCEERFGATRVKEILEKKDIPGIAEITHHLLKDKDIFPEFMDFARAIVTMQDRIVVVQGFIATLGISKPILQKIGMETGAIPKKKAPIHKKP